MRNNTFFAESSNPPSQKLKINDLNRKRIDLMSYRKRLRMVYIFFMYLLRLFMKYMHEKACSFLGQGSVRKFLFSN